MRCERAARQRRADEANGIDRVYRGTKNVVEISSKPLEGPAQ
jgi:hypothetical protein